MAEPKNSHFLVRDGFGSIIGRRHVVHMIRGSSVPFQLRRNRLTADQHRAARDAAWRIWREVAGIEQVDAMLTGHHDAVNPCGPYGVVY